MQIEREVVRDRRGAYHRGGETREDHAMLRTLAQSIACLVALCFIVGAPPVPAAAGDDPEWISLIGDDPLAAWRKPAGSWFEAGDARPDPRDAKRLVPVDGKGVIINGKTGKTNNLVTRESFGDLEAHFEFLVPKGSNSGVKFEGLYEIQIIDSHGVARPKATHSGGIYPRAELLPRYRYLDEGTPPRVNAARPAGEWQTLDVVFRAPRFDASGKKVADARFEKVVMNGQIIHQDVAVKTPTGHAWHTREVASGPLLLQADHGPVAFRQIRVRPLGDRKEQAAASKASR
jgi:hypothetical protein